LPSFAIVKALVIALIPVATTCGCSFGHHEPEKLPPVETFIAGADVPEVREILFSIMEAQERELVSSAMYVMVFKHKHTMVEPQCHIEETGQAYFLTERDRGVRIVAPLHPCRKVHRKHRDEAHEAQQTNRRRLQRELDNIGKLWVARYESREIRLFRDNRVYRPWQSGDAREP
jgi:hypothetical protein